MSLKSGISVIVTVFNKEKFIENTLKSIEPQMNRNVQLIIVDDGSTDNSKKKIKNFLKNKKYNFKFISKPNTGPSISINTAAKFAKFSHIKIVDGDDIIAPDSLKYMFSEMERLKLDLLYGHWEWIKNIFNYKFKKDSSPSFIFNNAFKKFILSGWGGSSNLMVRTDAFKKVGGFDESVFVQDYSLPLKIAGFHLRSKTNKRLSVGLSKKLITNSENKTKLLVRKSLVASKDIKKGEVFSYDNITTKRPALGISPFKINSYIGRKSKKNFKKNQLIK